VRFSCAASIKEYRNQFIQQLTPICDAGEAEKFFFIWLLEGWQLKELTWLYILIWFFSEEEIVVWNSILELVGDSNSILARKNQFYGLDFY
jgi:release factor glutamine methyltransferase